MQSLIDAIRNEGRYLGNSILKVDSFLNHQVDPDLMTEIGRTFFERLGKNHSKPITKILTAEASGIMPALTTAIEADCRMIYARKTASKTMVDEFYEADAISRTRGNPVTLKVNKNYLKAGDQVLIIDDFLAVGSTIGAMAEIIEQAGADLIGIGAVIEKPAEGGRERITQHIVNACPIASLARITFGNADEIIVDAGKIATTAPTTAHQ